ncbi:alkaline shock response membrane anchor protein AmaP [Streptomyces specialis]|uniref:alkaline shock response membrane anchor protein AmaP n=1 Tax=Streptomyces specialis TaxID=498367 RepID=UPI00073ECE18|nr:alkaline shock response membrane anchor protein AmaP [Streptomyces specialis]
MLRVVNRVLIGLTGLVLFCTGLAAVVAALDVPHRMGVDMPDGWSWRAPEDVLLTHADRTQWRGESWWWPVVIGGLALLVLLALGWLLAQLRRRRLTEILVDSGDGVGALLRGRAMEDVVAAESEALPGIDRARVTLIGRRDRPRIRIGLLLTPQASPATLVHRLRTEAVDHARLSAGLPALPTEARLRATKHTPERVS